MVEEKARCAASTASKRYCCPQNSQPTSISSRSARMLSASSRTQAAQHARPRARGCRSRQNAGPYARPAAARNAAAFLPRTGGAGWCPRPASAARRGSGWMARWRCGCSPRCGRSGLRFRGAAGPAAARLPSPLRGMRWISRPAATCRWPPAPAPCPAARTAACSAAAHPTGAPAFHGGRRAAAPRPGRVAGPGGGPWGRA
jgi:hypothetical protein